METIDFHDCAGLSHIQLARIQRTLLTRIARRDRDNIWAIGFGPKVRDGCTLKQLSARFLLDRKIANPPTSKRIPGSVRVRLRDSATGSYLRLLITTDLEAAPRPLPTGIQVAARHATATSALVLRWTLQKSPNLDYESPTNHDWKWGLLTVGHLLTASRTKSSSNLEIKIERQLDCDKTRANIVGEVVARGRLPGGPDAMLVETGRDRLWLSGLLQSPNVPPLPTLSNHETISWIRDITHGYIHHDGFVGQWRFSTYLPAVTIDRLGRLAHVIRFEEISDASNAMPLSPGSSGSILTQAGRPSAMQIAAESPLFRVGYAQVLTPVLGWLQTQLRCRKIEIAHVI